MKLFIFSKKGIKSAKNITAFFIARLFLGGDLKLVEIECSEDVRRFLFFLEFLVERFISKFIWD